MRKSSITKFKAVFLYAFIILTFGCSKQDADYDAKLKETTYFHNSVNAITDIMVHDIFSPPVASRVYAYTSIAAYEALVFDNPNLVSLANQVNGLTEIPHPADVDLCNAEIASLTAYLEVSKALLFSTKDIEVYEKKMWKEIIGLGVPEDVYDYSKLYGTEVATHIITWMETDKYKETRTYPKYTFNGEVDVWEPTPPGYIAAIEPHWNKIRPFVLKSGSQIIPEAPTEFDLEKESQFYKELVEVYEVGNDLTKEQEAIAQFWDCNPYVSHQKSHVMFATKKITPGGHWVGITLIASESSNVNYARSVEALARVTIAMADAFINCWDAKYKTALVRPETLINKFLDEEWEPLLQTPPFPEYTSGHSVVSGAASVVLTNFFGESFEFDDTSELAYGLPVRSFKSFYAAAEEAAISRLYGGIHYMPAISNGVAQGKKIGKYLVGNVVTRKNKDI